MKRIDVASAPRDIDSIFDWISANVERLAIGALIAAAIIVVMLGLRWIGLRWAEGDPDCRRWRGIIGRALSKTSIWFMVAAAVDIVASYASLPPKLSRLADIFFIIASTLQAAIWAREIIIGVIRSRVGDDPGASTLGNAMVIIRVLVSVALFAIALIGSLQGASHVVSAQTATSTSYNVLTTTLDRSAPELIDDLSYAGGNRELLEAHFARYKDAATPEEERAAALALTKVMEETIVRLEVTDDPREVARRKSLQGKIQTLTRQRAVYTEAQTAWETSASTTTGKLAVQLGLAGNPDPITE